MTEDFQSVAAQIEDILSRNFSPEILEVFDDSDRHKGHAGHNGKGQSHFSVTIVSESFSGKTRIERHQMIYRSLDFLMKTQIHALQITAFDPSESRSKRE